jgi:hypothetical protein
MMIHSFIAPTKIIMQQWLLRIKAAGVRKIKF